MVHYRNTAGCINHEYLIAELSLGPTILGYVRLESLCRDPTTSSTEPVPVAPSHSTSAGNDLPLLEFTHLFGARRRCVCITPLN
ncbi:hypothetical protein K443DRAFT_677038 [Laccaria amethystina LaAM-08-1]|uniref:Uncharacterized protein n=1 Tax=Laccaria amethystina LaAM-08-1 TaxID=1095629 RepID=A0A0C9XZN7_9AGAR|nr:hypothetical protein K443DRAFT_677038 [Laccaria amethystina LaAM-08-1]